MVGVGRGDDQLAHATGDTERDRARDETAEVEAKEIGLGDAELVEQGDHVTGQRVDCHRAVGVGGATVALAFHRDYLSARRKGVRAEVRSSGLWS